MIKKIKFKISTKKLTRVVLSADGGGKRKKHLNKLKIIPFNILQKLYPSQIGGLAVC